jgi:hypothetical protein
MSGGDCKSGGAAALERRALWMLLGINATLFVGEAVAGWVGQSTGLMADSLDMLADASVYGIALYAVGRSRGLQATAATRQWSPPDRPRLGRAVGGGAAVSLRQRAGVRAKNRSAAADTANPSRYVLRSTTTALLARTSIRPGRLTHSAIRKLPAGRNHRRGVATPVATPVATLVATSCPILGKHRGAPTKKPRELNYRGASFRNH